MGTTAGLVTVAEFERMKDPAGFKLELHHGEVVKVPPPTTDHAEIQDRLLDVLRSVASAEWKIRTEFAFRPLEEHEVWAADVGVMRRERWQSALEKHEYPLGAPEIVVEVLSPSNTVREMFDREQTCFEGGCREFWVVDPETRRIYVTSPDSPKRAYGSGDQVRSVVLSGAAIAIDNIFL